MLPPFGQPGGTHSRMVGRVPMQKHVAALSQQKWMDSQVRLGGTVTIQSRYESTVAIVITLNEVKIAVRMTGDEVIHPAEGMPYRLTGRWQRRPAKVENIAAQDEGMGPSSGLMNRHFVPRRL